MYNNYYIYTFTLNTMKYTITNQYVYTYVYTLTLGRMLPVKLSVSSCGVALMSLRVVSLLRLSSLLRNVTYCAEIYVKNEDNSHIYMKFR
jgi:hypothetical protein